MLVFLFNLEKILNAGRMRARGGERGGEALDKRAIVFLVFSSPNYFVFFFTLELFHSCLILFRSSLDEREDLEKKKKKKQKKKREKRQGKKTKQWGEGEIQSTVFSITT